MPLMLCIISSWSTTDFNPDSDFCRFFESCQHFSVSGPSSPAQEGGEVNTPAILQPVEDVSLCLKVLLPLGGPTESPLTLQQSPWLHRMTLLAFFIRCCTCLHFCSMGSSPVLIPLKPCLLVMYQLS